MEYGGRENQAETGYGAGTVVTQGSEYGGGAQANSGTSYGGDMGSLGGPEGYGAGSAMTSGMQEAGFEDSLSYISSPMGGEDKREITGTLCPTNGNCGSCTRRCTIKV